MILPLAGDLQLAVREEFFPVMVPVPEPFVEPCHDRIMPLDALGTGQDMVVFPFYLNHFDRFSKDFQSHPQLQ